MTTGDAIGSGIEEAYIFGHLGFLVVDEAGIVIWESDLLLQRQENIIDNSVYEWCPQLKNLLPQIVDYKGPVYIRMFRKSTPDIFDENETFNLFKSQKIKHGEDISIFCSGIMVDETLKANKKLEEMGINAEIINIHTIKPIDEESIISSVQKTKAAVTVENHNIVGGLRSAVSEVICENYPVPVRSVGIRDTFGQVGKMPYLKEIYKMTEKDIISAVVAAIEAKVY